MKVYYVTFEHSPGQLVAWEPKATDEVDAIAQTRAEFSPSRIEVRRVEDGPVVAVWASVTQEDKR